MKLGSTVIDAGPIRFALEYRYLDADQGVCIQVAGDVDGTQTELLRFDCFDQNPHYHYGPSDKNRLIRIDKTTAGNPVGWALAQLRTKLPDMLARAGYEQLKKQIDLKKMRATFNKLEDLAREMASNERNTVTHNRGDVIVDAGAIRFGLEYRDLGSDRGQAIHVLGDVAGQEIELLAFDCFENAPHYHYGPRNKNIRIYWDKTLVPDTLRWTLDQFKARKLGKMIERAGYPGIVSELDEELIQAKLREVEATAVAMEKEHA